MATDSGSSPGVAWWWPLRAQLPVRGGRSAWRGVAGPDPAGASLPVNRRPHLPRLPPITRWWCACSAGRALFVAVSLRFTTRVIRCRTRLTCQRHRGPTRPGPRPRPASSGVPAHTAVYWLTPLPLVDASPRGAAAPAWSSLRGSRCTLGRNPLRTQEHRRCGRGGCGLPAAMSIAQCSFLPMGNALLSGTPEKLRYT